ncbi:flavin monoamine oxidase family protein [Gordonia alkanivorans]|uniref:Putative flavin-containing amine oxidase n=1 Tax=Gordonia alkanivorans NBRC 16433 TaxID=1027371 RepID=F9VRR0_9ACTN|nr:NAD(P)/FAD-dependent oxidoreductase [Gordonia alkanivorans]GAA11299.1 putative flavin-containing amine oxidase [Gordonia alkanivorans NBRC 16433]
MDVHSTHTEGPTIPTQTATVAVVGAGLAGLTAARALHLAGVDVLVLEAADRSGGRAMSETTALGSRVDLGGQWIGHDHHRIASLAAELGATQFRMHTTPMPTILDGARRVSLSAPPMLATAGLLLCLEALSHIHPPQRWAAKTVADWLAKVPWRTSRRALELIALTSWTADLDRFSVKAMLKAIRLQGGLRTMLSTTGGAQESLLVEGVGTLVDRLADEMGPRIRLGHRVTSIVRDADGITLSTTAGTIQAAKVVVTVPPPLLNRINFLPSLPTDLIAIATSTYMGSVYKAIAVFDRPFWRDHGTNAQIMVLDSPGIAVFDTSPPDGPGHLCMLVAGPRARALDQLDATSRRETVLGPLVSQLGAELLKPVSWHEKAWHLDDNVGGGYTALPEPGITDAGMPLAFTPVGGIHWAGSESAVDHPGYLDGAIESGTRVAREVLDVLLKQRNEVTPR